MSRRRGCAKCCRPCAVFSDDFDGDDSDDLTPDWDERSGDWERLNNELVENGNAGALIICQTETATEEQSVHVTGTRNAGDIVGAVCNYLDDSRYFYAEIEDIGPDTEVRLYRVPGGLLHSATVLQVPSPGGLTICFSESSFSVLAGEAIVYDCNPSIHVGGKKAGIRNGSGNVTTFETFVLEHFIGKDGNFPGNKCCLQQCLCYYNGLPTCIPRTLTLTFNAWGGCLPLDGIEVELTYQPVTGDWRGAGPIGAIGNVEWALQCNEGLCPPLSADPHSFKLQSFDGTLCEAVTLPNDDCFAIDQGQTSYTCSPLVIEFPGENFVGLDPPDPGECFFCDQLKPGGYTITVTV